MKERVVFLSAMVSTNDNFDSDMTESNLLVPDAANEIDDNEVEMPKAEPAKHASKRKATNKNGTSGSSQATTIAAVKQPGQTKGAQQLRNYRGNYPVATAVSALRAVKAKKAKRAEQPSESYKSFDRMLVLSASHGQEDRRLYPKGSE